MLKRIIPGTKTQTFIPAKLNNYTEGYKTYFYTNRCYNLRNTLFYIIIVYI